MTESSEPKREDEILAQLFIQQGLDKSAITQLKKFDSAMERGSTEVAATHLGKALEAIGTFGQNLVSPRLTSQENEEWKELREKPPYLLSEGQFLRNIQLQQKAMGVGTPAGEERIAKVFGALREEWKRKQS